MELETPTTFMGIMKKKLTDGAYKDYEQRLEYIGLNTKYALKTLDAIFEENPKLFNKLINDVDINIETYWYSYCISGFSDKELFDQVFITMVGEFGEPTREALSNTIRYKFTMTDEDNNFETYMYVKVEPHVTGCKIVKEKKWIPEQVVKKEAHWKDVNRIECDS